MNDKVGTAWYKCALLLLRLLLLLPQPQLLLGREVSPGMYKATTNLSMLRQMRQSRAAAMEFRKLGCV